MPLKRAKSGRTGNKTHLKRLLHEGRAVQPTIPGMTDLGTKKPSGHGKIVPKSSRADLDATGCYEIKYLTINGKVYGPYLYLRFYDGKRKRSKYLGKAPR